MVHVTGLELALIPAGSALAGVALGIAGQGRLDQRKDRRQALQVRDAAIAELLTATVDVVQAVQAIRAAYQGHDSWRGLARKAVVVVSAVGVVLPGKPGDPMPRTWGEWSAVLDWRGLSPGLERLLAEVRHLDDAQRRIALDIATVVVPRTARFYAAVSVLTLGPDKDLAAAVRRLTPTVGELLEVIAAKPRVYDRVRKRAEDALGEFRDTADKRRR